MGKQRLETTVAKVLDEMREHPIPLRVSNRHIHLCAEDYGHLSPNRPIGKKKGLLQLGQCVAEQTVTLMGPRGQLKSVHSLGPLHSTGQVEIFRIGTRTSGVATPLQVSGNIQSTSGVRLVSSSAELGLASGVVIAQRHIHISPLDALILQVSHGDEVSVAIDSDKRRLVSGNIAVRVSSDMRLEMHIDADEANAASADNPRAFAALVTSR